MLPLTSGFKRYFANTSWMIGERVIRRVVALFVGAYVARYLGPERFGLLSYAMSLAILFSAIGAMGLDGIVVRDLVKEPDKSQDLLGTAFVLKIIGASLLLVLVFFAARLMSDDRFTVILVLIIAGGTFFQAFQVIDFFFQAKVLAKFPCIARFASLLVSSISRLVLIALNAPLIWFAWVLVLESLIVNLSLVVLYRKQGMSAFHWKFKKDVATGLLRDSWPLILSGMAIMVYMRIDQIMIKEMLGSEAVGNYAAAVNLSEAWYFIPVMVCNSLFPAIMTAKTVNDRFYHQRLQKLYFFMVWCAIAVALPTTFLSEFVITLLFGPDYIQSAAVLNIYIWSGVFVFLGVASGKWFLAENLQKYSFYNAVAGGISNIILNLLLIPEFGIKGAAIATIISYGISSYLAMIFFKCTRINFRLATTAFNPYLAIKSIWNA